MRVNSKEIKVFGWCVLCALLMLFFCSKSSPGYPVNDWSDANIYFTIGKGMTQGQVVYRDLYDHKGPLLYAVHAVCALLSFADFTGVFAVEVLCAAAFLYGTAKFWRLFGAEKLALIPLLAMLLYTSVSFGQGDSAEELCLPMMAATLYGVSAYLLGKESRMKTQSLILQGFWVGCVFWTKFTLIGIQAGLLGWVLVRHLYQKEWKFFLISTGWLLAGFAVSTLPWIVYFGLNGAIGDWLGVYLYDNLFLYSAGESAGLLSRAKAMTLSGLEWLWQNLRYTIVLALGLVWTLKNPKIRWAMLLMAAFGALTVFIGGKSYPYYGFALAGMTALGFVPIAKKLNKTPKWLPVAALCASVALCPVVSHNMTADYGAPFGSPKEDTMQYQMAAHLPKDASLLNYGFMDAGFYTAAGLTPQVKYFHRTNVPKDEMVSEQYRYIDEGVTDYVITRMELTETQLTHYEKMAETSSPNFWYEKVYLYRRKP